MTSKCISSVYIQKLGHEILEIRERALYYINSKLSNGICFDNDLARSRELLKKLLDWFLLEPCTQQETVFSLIKGIIQSESGHILVQHEGCSVLRNKLNQLRSYIQPKYYPYLNDCLEILGTIPIVPPLQSDLPLSYRTGQSDYSKRAVETTATTIEGFVYQDSSRQQQGCPNIKIEVFSFKWQFLIESDRLVLQSIENSLKNPPQPVSLLHSADFFSNILLHDFPAEVFLQRPVIVQVLHNLIDNCSSTRIIFATLNCLIDLTKALRVRINHCNDPALIGTFTNLSNQTTSRSSTPDSTSRKTASGQSEDDAESADVYEHLKTQQMSLNHYCFLSFKCIFGYLKNKSDNSRPLVTQKGVNSAFVLLEELMNLLYLIIEDGWIEDQSVRQYMNEFLVDYGTLLEYFRIESGSDDNNVNLRLYQLCLLHYCVNFLLKFVSLSQTGLILPRNLKLVLTNSLLDVSLLKLYPQLHKNLLDYVNSFKVGLESDSLTKFYDTNKICESMGAAVLFLKGKSLKTNEGINLALKALPGLEFHRELKFVHKVIEIGVNKLPLNLHDEAILEKFESAILQLLSYNVLQIQEETYRLCQAKVIGAIGPKLNFSGSGGPGNQILFLLRAKILTEIASHGLGNANVEIRNCAEDILIHIIKCKILVSEEIWNRIVVSLIGGFPILLCFCDKSTSMGKSILNIIDPDTAENLLLPKIEVIKGNLLALFNHDGSIREEAFSRLCWLLASQNDSREMLPRLNNLYDKALPNVCQCQRILDINRIRVAHHFYQPSSLQQLIDLLKSNKVEPVIRRSALTQASVMMEDPLLHSIFIENGGLLLIINILHDALIEKKYNDYPDSVIPIISILKNICLYQPSIRQELGQNIDILFNIIRSLFLYFTEEKLKYDAVYLLFLILFGDFINGSPSRGNFSIPHVVCQQIYCPFICQTHWENSRFRNDSLLDLVLSDKWCLSSIQIQWNLEIFGGFDELLSWKEVDYSETRIVDILKLTNYDLAKLKASSIDYYIKLYLDKIQNGILHDDVIENLNKLTTYLLLYRVAASTIPFLSYQWEATFGRFMKTLPSSEDDAKLLSAVLKFLKLLVPYYKNYGE